MIKDKFYLSLITECTDNILMYGLELRTDRTRYTYPSLTSDRSAIEEFLSTLNQNDFSVEVFPELIEDFLEELYGE